MQKRIISNDPRDYQAGNLSQASFRETPGIFLEPDVHSNHNRASGLEAHGTKKIQEIQEI